LEKIENIEDKSAAVGVRGLVCEKERAYGEKGKR